MCLLLLSFPSIPSHSSTQRPKRLCSFPGAPLGSIWSFSSTTPVKNVAIGYSPGGRFLNDDDDGVRWLEGRAWMENTFLHSIKGGPAGGGYSTPTDLLRFARALTAGELVSAETLALMASAKPDSDGYGYGFQLAEHPGLGPRFGHSGGFPGINAHLRVYTESGYTIAAMSNMDRAAGVLAGQVERMLAGR